MISKNILSLIVLMICFSLFLAEEEKVTDLEQDLKEVKEMMDGMNNGTETFASQEGDMDFQFKEALEQMGIGQSETIDRETFKKLFAKVILEDEVPEGEEKEMFDKLIERVVNNAPETFPTKDLNKYVDMSFITNVLNEVMSEAGIDPAQAFSQMARGEEEDSAEGVEEGEGAEEKKPDL